MIRRFDEHQLQPGSLRTPESSQEMPAFSAISIQMLSPHVQQAWLTMYQAAWAHAIAQALQAASPTRYQRLMYHICLN